RSNPAKVTGRKSTRIGKARGLMEVMMSLRRLLSCSRRRGHSVGLPALKCKICKVSNINSEALRGILGPSRDEFYAYLFLGGIPVMGGHPVKYVIQQYK